MVLEGQVALVTGGGQGIGRAIALRLAREGADIALIDVNREAAEVTGREVSEVGRRAMIEVADVSDWAGVEGSVTRIVEELGKLDVLVNNAGFETRAPFLEITPPTGNASWTSICRGRSTAPSRPRGRWRSDRTGAS